MIILFFSQNMLWEQCVYYSKELSQKEFVIKKWLSYFSLKTYVVGNQKNRLIETALLSTENKC